MERLEDRITPSTLHWLGSSAPGGDLWNAPGNWQQNQVPASGDTLVFDTTTPGFSATTNGLNPSNNLADLADLTITINDASIAGDFNLTGNALALAAAGVSSNVTAGAAATVTLNMALPATTAFAASGAPLTIAGSLSGAGGLSLLGPGTLVLQGGNTYAGSTLINQGTLKVGAAFAGAGLVAHYGFEGNTNNDAGNPSINGTIVAGSGATYVAGRFGQAMNFTGSQSVRVDYNAALALNTFTVSAWVKLNVAPGVFGVLGTRTGGDQTFGFKVGSNVIAGEIGNGTNWLHTGLSVNQVVPTGSWHMITYVVDNAAQRATVYYDGVPRNTYNLTGTPLFMKPGQRMTIGQDYIGEAMKGAIDEVSLYASPLTDSDVASLYASNVLAGPIPRVSPVVISAGASLDLAGNSTAVGSLAGGGGVTNSAPASATLTIGADDSSTDFAGIIQNGAGTVSVTKIGTGTQTLSGANTYTGATNVLAGVLEYPPQITSVNNATLLVGTPGAFSATASGVPAPSFSVAGALPAGITLSPTGVFSGTPAANSVGSYPVIITADNGVGAPSTQSFTLTIATLPVITSPNTTTFQVGQPGNFSVLATGFPTPTFTASGTMPTGVTLSSAGLLSGTPVPGTGGTYPITITASNGAAVSGTQPFTLIVNEAPAITSAASATFPLSQNNSFTVTATGYPAPTKSLTGALPDGVSFSAAGVFSGTPGPGTTGNYPITITASNGVGQPASQSFTLVVAQPPAFTSPNAATFTVGQAGSFAVQTTGFPAPTVTGTSTGNPYKPFEWLGLTLSPDGVLSGTPLAFSGGQYTYDLSASNGVGAVATQRFTLKINESPVFSRPPSETMRVGKFLTFSVSASGFPAPSHTISGPLPTGITIDATGQGGGTPAAGTAGVYPILVTAINAIGGPVAQTFTLIVNEQSSITSANHTTFVVGQAGTFTASASGVPAPTIEINGTLPPGITRNGNTLSGTPTGAGGVYPLTITASNGVDHAASQQFSFVVNKAPAITSAPVARFFVGNEGDFEVTASGFPAPTFSRSGALPEGMAFSSAGVLSGEPAPGTEGQYPVTITASNGVGSVATQVLTILVGKPAFVKTRYPVGDGVRYLAAADFRGTGLTDLAVIESSTVAVTVLMNNGSGAFPTSKTTPTADNPPLISGDFNKDGRSDLVITHGLSLKLYLGAADGSFTAGSIVTLPAAPASTLVVDVNNDANLDLVVADISSSNTSSSLFLGKGDGTFQPLRSIATGGFRPPAFVAGNFFGDGKVSLVSVTQFGNEMAVFRGNGDGTFQAPLRSHLDSTGVFDAGDIDADGLPDLAVAAPYYDASVKVLRNLGDGTFGSPVSIPIDGYVAHGVRLVDFNGDGLADLSFRTDYLEIVMNQGNGMFGNPVEVEVAGSLVGTITPGDFNGDGKLDFAVGAYHTPGEVEVSLNNMAGPTDPPSMVSANQTHVIVASPSSFAVRSSSFFPVTYSATGALPPGMTFSAAGVLSGTPAPGSAGVYPITISASNGVGAPTTQSFTLTVDYLLNIVSADHAAFAAGSAGSFAVQTNGFAAATFAVTGVLPAGVSLSPAGVLSGTPAVGSGGVYSFVIIANDGSLPPATQSFTLTVNEDVTITTAHNGGFVVGKSGTFAVAARGFPAPMFSAAGALPTGVSFNSAGIFSGTPTVGGAFPIVITASNANGSTATQAFTLISRFPTVMTLSTSSNNATYGQSVTLTATVNAVIAGNGVPGGSVTFYSNGVSLGAAWLSGVAGDNRATLTTTAIPVGVNDITAEYRGNIKFQTSDWGTLSNPLISTYAGNGSPNSSGDGGAASNAGVGSPFGLAVDAAGNLLISQDSNRVRQVLASTQIINRVAGTGNSGYNGDNRPAGNALLNGPIGVAYDTAGNFYIAELFGNRIRKVAAGTNTISTIAGTGVAGYNGDNISAASAQINRPYGIVVDSAGNIYFSDSGNNRVRKISAGTNLVTTVAGAGAAGYNGDNILATDAQLNYPQFLALDAAGNLYIADTDNARVRMVSVTTKRITTVAGTGVPGFNGDNQPATSAQLRNPSGLAVDANGNLFIADQSNLRVREVLAGSKQIITIAGTGADGFNGDNRDPRTAMVSYPTDVEVDRAGNIFVTDRPNNNRVRKVTGAAVMQISVKPAPNVTTTAALFTASIFKSFDVTIAGALAPTFSYTGALPGGLTLEANGVLSGTTADIGTFPITITATEGGTPTILAFTLTVVAPAITSASAATFVISAPNSFNVQAAGIANPSFSVAGALPGGVTFDPLSGLLSGIPQGGTAGIYPLTFTVTPSGSTQSFTLTIINNITTIVGNVSEEGIPATQAALSAAERTAFDAAGNLYIADLDNRRVRKVSPSGTISTFAGNGNSGETGDGLPAASTALAYPSAVATDAAGNVYILNGNAILRVGLDGIISLVFPGTGASGALDLAVDAAGNAFIADTGNNRVLKVTPGGAVSTVAGTGVVGFSGDNGPATSAKLSRPVGVAVDAAGNLFIADQFNGRIRRVGTNGIITTLAGNGTRGYGGDGGQATSAALFDPDDMAVDAAGVVYISDRVNGRVRKVSLDGTISTVAGAGVALGVPFVISAHNGARAILAPFPDVGGIALDAAGTLYIASTVFPGDAVWRVDAAGILHLVAGNGTAKYGAGYSGDGGSAAAARISAPRALAMDVVGNVFIAEGNRVRRVGIDGRITTVAGGANPGFSGDNGPAAAALLNEPNALTLDAAGNLYIADALGSVVRKVTPAGIITTIAGRPFFSGTPLGDGGPATAALLGGVEGLAIDAAGDLLIADAGNHSIRKVANGIITTIAGRRDFAGFGGDGGPVTNAYFNRPGNLFFDKLGNLYIFDQHNQRVRKVDTSGIITTVAGGGTNFPGDGLPATAAGLTAVAGAVDASGNLWIVSQNRVRRIDKNTTIITTVAGNAAAGYNGDHIPAGSALLNNPQALLFNQRGDLIIADTANNRIRSIDLASPSFPSISLPSWPALRSGYVAALEATAGSTPYSYAVTAGAVPPGLALSGAGVLSGTPTTPGDYAFTVTVTYTLGATAVKRLTVTIGPAVTATTVSATPQATTGGTLVTFTAAIAPNPGNVGTVSFFDNGTPLPGGTDVALQNGVASFQTSTLAVGSHPITAAYSGAPGFVASVSSILNFGVVSSLPQVVSVTPNGNLGVLAGNQRSQVVSLQVVFNQPVQLDAGAMALALHQTNVVFGGVAGPAGSVPTNLVLSSTDKVTWVVTFSGNTDPAAPPATGLNSLKDGVYDFRVDAAKVHPLGEPSVSMVAGSTTTFHRLFGDTGAPTTPAGGTPGVDFEAIVNTGDNLAFRGAFNSPAAYKAVFDFNGDGLINTGDNLQFRARFNKSLTWKV